MTKKELEILKQLEKNGYFTCFRTGVWKDNSGKTHNITQGDLENIMNNFDQNENEVSFVIGHPEKEEKDHEQGKIESLMMFGDYLLARAKQVKKDFLEKIKNGFYRFVSIAINPKFQLQHIGVTNEPAVEGLLPITSAFSKGCILYTFEMTKLLPEHQQDAIRTAEKIKTIETFFTGLFNKEQAKKEEPMKDEEGTKVPETKQEGPPEVNKKLSEFEKRALKAEQKAQAAEQKLAEIEEQNRKDTISTFTKSLLEKKKLYPNEVDGMIEFLLKQDDQESYQFSKDSKNQTSLQFIQGFLKGLPDRLPLDKIQESKKKIGQDSACFSRIKPDDENMDLHYQAKTLMEKEKISYDEALARLED